MEQDIGYIATLLTIQTVWFLLRIEPKNRLEHIFKRTGFVMIIFYCSLQILNTILDMLLRG